MSDVASLITDLVSAGVSAELVGRVAAALASREAVVVKVGDEAAERRRAADAKKTAARRSLLPKDWEGVRAAIFERDSYTCAYCGTRNGPLHCDHVVPLSRGGTNDESNLATSCEACNLSKGSRLVSEWRRA